MDQEPYPSSAWRDPRVHGVGQWVLSPQQTRDAKILRRSVLRHFQTLPDPRVKRTQHHRLVAMVTIALFAVLAGADGFVGIERYGKAKQSWLETFLDLPHGIPSHDTFGRVMGALDPQTLEAGFLAWVGRITEGLGVALMHIADTGEVNLAGGLPVQGRIRLVAGSPQGVDDSAGVDHEHGLGSGRTAV